MQELDDPHLYDILLSDPTESVISTVKAWSNKWTLKGEINEDIRVYIENIGDSPVSYTHLTLPTSDGV